MRNVYGLLLHSAAKPELPTGEKKFLSLRPEEKGKDSFLPGELAALAIGSLFRTHHTNSLVAIYEVVISVMLTEMSLEWLEELLNCIEMFISWYCITFWRLVIALHSNIVTIEFLKG